MPRRRAPDPKDSVHRIGHEFESCGPSNSARFIFVDERAESRVFAVDFYRHAPSLISLIPGYTSILRRRSGMARLVLDLAAFWDDAQVGPLIVQFVEINVIAFSAITFSWQSEKFSVQED